jgi:hypothetical protein
MLTSRATTAEFFSAGNGRRTEKAMRQRMAFLFYKAVSLGV